MGTSPAVSRPGADLRSRRGRKCVFPPRKTSWKRTTIERETYVQKGGWAENERQREERDRVTPLSSVDDIRGERAEERGWGEGVRVGNVGRKWSKVTCDLRRLLSFSSHCSPLSLLFTFPVPRSPFSELHAPNPTSDPHKGRRGRDTFGKSSSTPLQRIRRESLRNRWFLDMFAFLTA